MGPRASAAFRRDQDFEEPPGPLNHPFLAGNYAPQQREQPLTPCQIKHGQVPPELAGSQYVRNGGNASDKFDEERDAHWFDADGMLAGVFFKRADNGVSIVPHFVNRFILTDIHLATSVHAQRAILPSIATLINPSVSLFRLTADILRAVVLVFATWIPFLWSGPLAAWQNGGGKVKRISVANTSIWWHDRKALAGCESGPPIQVRLPDLDTGEWWVGQGSLADDATKTWAQGPGLLKHFREYTTAHPKVDPVSGDLLLYHMCFVAPFLRVSVIPTRDGSSQYVGSAQAGKPQRAPVLGATVPGLLQPKLMHDFGCTRTRTVILDLPLSLDPRNLLKGRPVMHYDARQVGRLGIFPRWAPDQVQWIDTREAFCVYHTANTWDDDVPLLSGSNGRGTTPALNLLACRLNSATLAYVAGNVPPPPHVLPATQQQEKCQLYYWRIEGGPEVEPATAPLEPAASVRPDLVAVTATSRPPSYQSSAASGALTLDASASSPPLSPPPTYADISGEGSSPSARAEFRPPQVSGSTSSSSSIRAPPASASRAAISCEFPLSEIPFEFPTLHRARQMQAADFIYGTSTRASGFDSRLQKVGTGAAKIDCLVKVHARRLIARGLREWEAGSERLRAGAAVDERSVGDIIQQQETRRRRQRRWAAQEDEATNAENPEEEEADPIQIFDMPTGWYAQEATFVPRAHARSEDDGFLLFYAFDELAGLDPSTGRCQPDATSELWILDARDMHTLLCRVGLPQRVPYGLHGEWFDEAKIASQELVPSLRQLEEEEEKAVRRRQRNLAVADDAQRERKGRGAGEKELLVQAVPSAEPELRRRYRAPPGEVASLITPGATDTAQPEGKLSRAAWRVRGALEEWLR
ncbi:hypothetical protein OC844_003007 [Tilletia horrida]|nr:hypothetical protein OC844_003007 [Tilletia horrida]